MQRQRVCLLRKLDEGMLGSDAETVGLQGVDLSLRRGEGGRYVSLQAGSKCLTGAGLRDNLACRMSRILRALLNVSTKATGREHIRVPITSL